MQYLLDSIIFIIKEIGPNNALLLFAFSTIGFSLYVLLTAIKILGSRKSNNE